MDPKIVAMALDANACRLLGKSIKISKETCLVFGYGSYLIRFGAIELTSIFIYHIH